MARINWQKEFDKADAERMEQFHQIRMEQMRKLFIELILNCDNEKYLRTSLVFFATKENLRLVEYSEGPKLEKEEGALI